MDYLKVADQLGDWGPKLRPFIESKEFDEIFKFLKSQSREGKIICPESKNLFRSFRETPYKDLRCIFLLQDPYPWIKGNKYIADGVAMSCANTGVCQPSLEKFYEGMEDDLGVKVPRIPDLSYLCRQGVMFLNTSLTVELNKSGSHTKDIFGKAGLWDKFILFLVEQVINFYNTGIVYVSLGDNAKIVTKAVIPFIHWGFEVEHPAVCTHKGGTWNHDKIFTKINRILKEHNNEQIKWVYEENNVEKMPELNTSGVRGRVIK